MKIDGHTSAEGQGAKVQTAPTSPASPAIDYKEGQVLSVRVLTSENGNAQLKTQEGNIFSAKLEGDVVLLPGTKALLVVSDLRDGALVLKINPDSALLQTKDGAGMQETMAHLFADKQLAPFARQLAALNLQFTQDTVLRMRDILKQAPQLSPEKAAFMAAENIPPEAAESLFHQAKTGKTLEALIQHIQLAAASKEQNQAQQPTVPTENPTVPQEPNAVAKTPSEPNQNTPMTLETQSAERIKVEMQVPQQAQEQLATGERVDDVRPQQLPLDRTTVIDSRTKLPELVQSAMSNAAGVVHAGTVDMSVKKLEQFLETLFAKPDNNSDEVGFQLKKTRDELHERLVQFERELIKADVNQKPAILEQTQKLLDHVRILDNIEQFQYSQLPVILNGEKQTAELYIYKKKKGSKKIDPDDVKILLALELTQLGHIESFICVKGKEVSLRIQVSQANAETAFKTNTIGLYKLLDQVGYKLTNTTVICSKEETSVESAMLRLLEYENSTATSFDLTV